MGGAGEERLGNRRAVRTAYLASLVFHAVLLILLVALLRPASDPQPVDAEPLGFDPWSAAAVQPVAQPATVSGQGSGQGSVVEKAARRSPGARRASPRGELRPEPARAADLAQAPRSAELVFRQAAAPLPAVPAEAAVVTSGVPGHASSSGVAGPSSARSAAPGSIATAPAGAGAGGRNPGGSPGATSTDVNASVGARMLLEHPDPDCVDEQGGASAEVQARICVAETGAVSNVTVMRASSEEVSVCLRRTVRSSWRYRPLTVDGRAVPFCYVAAFRFE